MLKVSKKRRNQRKKGISQRRIIRKIKTHRIKPHKIRYSRKKNGGMHHVKKVALGTLAGTKTILGEVIKDQAMKKTLGKKTDYKSQFDSRARMGVSKEACARWGHICTENNKENITLIVDENKMDIDQSYPNEIDENQL